MAQPGITAISTVVIMISAVASLRGCNPTDCTRAQAMGTIIAVRTVIEGIPRARTKPIKKKAHKIPAYVPGKSDRI